MLIFLDKKKNMAVQVPALISNEDLLCFRHKQTKPEANFPGKFLLFYNTVMVYTGCYQRNSLNS